MSVTISLREERSFIREAKILLAGGVLSGGVFTLLSLVTAAPVAALAALSFCAVVGLAANLSDDEEGTPMLRLGAALFGGASMAGLMVAGAPLAAAGAVGGLFLGVALSVGSDRPLAERVMVWAMYAGMMALAVFTSTRLVPLLPDIGLLRDVFQGGVWGFCLALAAGLKQLDWTRDPLRTLFHDALVEVGAEEQKTLESARNVYERIVVEIDRVREDDVRQNALEIAGETARVVVALTRRAAELREAAERSGMSELRERLLELDRRVKASKDATVRRELKAAMDEVAEQMTARSRLEVARARLEARQQRCLTALERLHVTLIQHSATSSDDSALQASLGTLQKLSEEVRWRNLSVDELLSDGDTEDGEGSDASLAPDVEELLEEIRAEGAARADEDDNDGETVLGVDESDADADGETVLEPEGTDGSLADSVDEEVVEEVAEAEQAR